MLEVRDRWEEMTWSSATQYLRVTFIYECWILLYRAVSLLTSQIPSFGLCEGRFRVAHYRAPELCSILSSLGSQLGVSSILQASPACLVRLQCFPALCDFRSLPFSSQIHSDPSASVLVGCINPIKIQPKAQEVPRDFWRNPFPHFSLFAVSPGHPSSSLVSGIHFPVLQFGKASVQTAGVNVFLFLEDYSCVYCSLFENSCCVCFDQFYVWLKQEGSKYQLTLS